MSGLFIALHYMTDFELDMLHLRGVKLQETWGHMNTAAMSSQPESSGFWRSHVLRQTMAWRKREGLNVHAVGLTPPAENSVAD